MFGNLGRNGRHVDDLRPKWGWIFATQSMPTLPADLRLVIEHRLTHLAWIQRSVGADMPCLLTMRLGALGFAIGLTIFESILRRGLR
jgi:hypothetical protein